MLFCLFVIIAKKRKEIREVRKKNYKHTTIQSVVKEVRIKKYQQNQQKTLLSLCRFTFI